MKINPGRLRTTVLFSLLIILSSKLNAQEYIAHIRKIGMENGLSSYNIESVFQDADGFIWLGTDNGLNRWDGSVIKSYNKEENGLCHNFVAGIMEDRNKMLWIAAGDKGGDRHYSVFNKYKEKFYSPEEYLGKPLPFKPQKTVAYESKGNIIFCEQEYTRRNDLIIYQYDGKRIRKLFALKENNQTQGKILEGMFETGENEYISFWRDIDYTKYTVQTCDEKGKILKSFQKDQKHPLILGTRMHQNKYFVICAGQQGDYWNLDFHINGIQHQKQDIRVKANWAERIAISENRIYILDSDSIKIYNKDGTKHAALRLGLSLKQSYFGLPLVDHDDNIWLHDQESVYCVSLTKKNFSVEVQNPGNPVRLRGIARTAEGHLITGGVGFLLEQQGPNRWESLLNLSFNYLGLLQKGDNLWLGTETYRLCKLNTLSLKMEEFPVESKSEETLSGMIWMPFISADGRVWAGGNKGFYRVDEVKKNLVPFKDASLAGISVYAFHQNKAGTWLCTSSGLMLVDLKQEKVLKKFNKSGKGSSFLPVEHITHLHEDKTGIFWLATKGDGLVRWNPKTGDYLQYTQKKSGLSNNVLYSVYGDDYGYLWISSQRGLMRFHKETGSVNVYLKEDGLPHNEFNTISHYKGPDGHLYFGDKMEWFISTPKILKKTLTNIHFLLQVLANKAMEIRTCSISRTNYRIHLR
jgi:streptogramin lyase